MSPREVPPFLLARPCSGGEKITESFNKERGIKVADLSHPPSHCTRLGRVNRANQPFFYCSASQEVIYYEIQGLSKGDEIVLSYWRTKAPLVVNNIDYTQCLFEAFGAKRPLPTWMGDQTHQELTLADEAAVKAQFAVLHSRADNREIRGAISKAFMADVGENEQYEYKLTAAIAELHMGNDQSPVQFAGILYPTIRMAANGDNLALKPKRVATYLEFFKAKHIKIDDRNGSTISFSIIDFSDSVLEDGNLRWKGRAPAFTLPSGDTGIFSCEEGRDEDGDYLISADGKVCHWVARDQRGNILKLG